MTTMNDPGGRVPEFTRGWRMRLALESAGISVQQMADDLGYSRSTISRWLNDLDEPREAIKAQWALLTSVDRTWLDTGVSTPTPPPDPGKRDTLAKLTENKRSRSRNTARGVSTARYPVAA